MRQAHTVTKPEKKNWEFYKKNKQKKLLVEGKQAKTM